MKQKLLYSLVSVEVFYGLWKWNAVTNKGKNPGPPGPTVPYKDRMRLAKDLPLIKWRNEDGCECKGTLEAHQQGINASLRETSQDVEAKDKGDEKEPERKQKVALSLNKKAMNFGDDTEIPNQKAASVRKESSESTNVRKDSLKKGGTK